MQIEKMLTIFQVVNNICDILKQQKNFFWSMEPCTENFFHTECKCWNKVSPQLSGGLGPKKVPDNRKKNPSLRLLGLQEFII